MNAKVWPNGKSFSTTLHLKSFVLSCAVIGWGYLAGHLAHAGKPFLVVNHWFKPWDSSVGMFQVNIHLFKNTSVFALRTLLTFGLFMHCSKPCFEVHLVGQIWHRKSRWLLWTVFVFMCLVRLPFSVNFKSQMSQANFFRPSWIVCVWRLNLARMAVE